MNESTGSAIDAPTWLPAWLEFFWRVLAAYPILLALVIVVVGLGLAFLVRRFILFWGIRITDRAHADLLGQLVRVGAWVAGMLVAYISLVTALHVLPLADFAISISKSLFPKETCGSGKCRCPEKIRMPAFFDRSVLLYCKRPVLGW